MPQHLKPGTKVKCVRINNQRAAKHLHVGLIYTVSNQYINGTDRNTVYLKGFVVPFDRNIFELVKETEFKPGTNVICTNLKDDLGGRVVYQRLNINKNYIVDKAVGDRVFLRDHPTSYLSSMFKEVSIKPPPELPYIEVEAKDEGKKQLLAMAKEIGNKKKTKDSVTKDPVKDGFVQIKSRPNIWFQVYDIEYVNDKGLFYAHLTVYNNDGMVRTLKAVQNTDITKHSLGINSNEHQTHMNWGYHDGKNGLHVLWPATYGKKHSEISRSDKWEVLDRKHSLQGWDTAGVLRTIEKPLRLKRHKDPMEIIHQTVISQIESWKNSFTPQLEQQLIDRRIKEDDINADPTKEYVPTIMIMRRLNDIKETYYVPI